MLFFARPYGVQLGGLLTPRNPRSASSDSIPPELAGLGLREALCARPIWPVSATSLTGRRSSSLVKWSLRFACSSTCVLTKFASTGPTLGQMKVQCAGEVLKFSIFLSWQLGASSENLYAEAALIYMHLHSLLWIQVGNPTLISIFKRLSRHISRLMKPLSGSRCR